MRSFLEIKEVNIGYENTLVKSINAQLNKGEVVLLMGNNGVGKTTLIKSLLKQLPLQSGEIYLDHKNLNFYNTQSIAEAISIVFSKSDIPQNYTVFDLVAFGKYIHYPYYFKLNAQDIADVEHIISRLQLDQYRNTLLIHLSDGNLQKAFIGRALAQNSSMIILDEPTTHLDEDNKLMILKLLRDLAKSDNKLILFSSHDWRLAKEFADQLWWIKDQQLFSGITEEVLQAKAELLLNQYVQFHPDFISPQIIAPDLEKELMYSFLQKNFEKNLSNFKILYQNGNWEVFFENYSDNCSDFFEVAQSLRKRM